MGIIIIRKWNLYCISLWVSWLFKTPCSRPISSNSNNGTEEKELLSRCKLYNMWYATIVSFTDFSQTSKLIDLVWMYSRYRVSLVWCCMLLAASCLSANLSAVSSETDSKYLQEAAVWLKFCQSLQAKAGIPCYQRHVPSVLSDAILQWSVVTMNMC
jgi:hypothetical protein